jgi:osmotically-inducible protein OsmY
MLKRTSVLILAGLMSAGTMVGCSSTDSRDGGAVERTASNAGRAVDDSVITGKVKAALVADPTTKAHQITVETFQGKVQLSGFVESSEARSRAVEIARNVEGVKDVKNSLQLRASG